MLADVLAENFLLVVRRAAARKNPKLDVSKITRANVIVEGDRTFVRCQYLSDGKFKTMQLDSGDLSAISVSTDDLG